MQRERIGRTNGEDLGGDRRAVGAGTARILGSSQRHQRRDLPAAGLRVIDRHVDVGEFARAEPGCDAFGQLQGADRRLRLQTGLLLHEAEIHQDLDIGAARRDRGARRFGDGLENGRRPLRRGKRSRILGIVEQLRFHGIGESQDDGGRLAVVAFPLQPLEQLQAAGRGGARGVHLAEKAGGFGEMHHGARSVARAVRAPQRHGQRVVVGDLAPREFHEHPQLAEALEFAGEVIREIAEQLFGLRAGPLRDALGIARALRAAVGEDGGGGRAYRERDAGSGDLPGAHQRVACGEFPVALFSEQPLSGVARFALPAQVAARLDDAAEHVVRELHAAHVQPLLDAQQAAVHQHRERVGCGTRSPETREHALLGDVLAESRRGEQFVLDDPPHHRRLVGEGALVEIAEDACMRSLEQVQGDLAPPLGQACVIELPADQAEQRGLDLGIGDFRAAGDEADDGGGDIPGHQPLPRLQHGSERLPARHGREPQPVLGDARHRALQALEGCEIILAQCDEHAIVAAREVEAFGRRVVGLEPFLERPRRAILDEIGEVLHEAGRAGAAEIVALREGEDFLELIEDEQRNQRGAGLVPQHVVAMVEELPQRLSGDGHARLRPLAGAPRRARDRLLDLLGGFGRVPAVVDAHIDRAIALCPQPRHETGAQDRGLAEAGLAEQHGEQLPLHAAREFRHLLFAAVEVGSGFLREGRETEPWVGGVDGRGGGIGCVGRIAHGDSIGPVHSCRARMKSATRRANSAGTSPPGSCVKCSALNLSGTRASAAAVASMLTGRMKRAPSAMFRTRSIA